MRDDLAEQLLAELRQLNQTIASFRDDVRLGASTIAAAQLIAVDAARSEVFAVLMDDQLAEVALRLNNLINKSDK
jgi:hypothetical protein